MKTADPPLQVRRVTTLADWAASAQFVDQIPIGFARRHGLIGLTPRGETDEARLPVAVADDVPFTLQQVQTVARFLRRPVEPILAPAAEVKAAINAAYGQRAGQAQAALQTVQKLDRGDVLGEVRQLTEREDLLDADSRAPVIRLVNLMLFEAVKARASDVHVQPTETSVTVRLRIDGVLYDSFDVPKAVQEEVASRVKVMGRMNVAERRLPQDGRASVQVGDQAIDLRISSLPTRFGGGTGPRWATSVG